MGAVDAAFAMADAYGQALGYARTLDKPPPFLVTVDIGAPLLVEVSARTIRQQGLAAQQPIWCLFKALALHSRA